MNLTALFVLLGVLLAAGVALRGLAFWLAGRLFRLPKATFWRALLLGVVVTALYLLAACFLFRIPGGPTSPVAYAGFYGVGIAGTLLFLWLFFRPSFGKLLGTWLLSEVFLVLPGMAVFWGLTTYAAEAFVQPSGSMAETLYGYHRNVECPRCGHAFAVNASSEVDPVGGHALHVRGCTCPNCRYEIDFERDRVDAVLISGDRFLAGKRPLFDPARLARFDLVAHDVPRSDDRPGPPVRYLKRLVGFPGEVIAVHGGQLFCLRAGTEPPGDEDALAARFEKGEFEIIRKPPAQVLALRRLVYDNDHPAKDLTDPAWARWAAKSEGAWQPDGAGGFKHAAPGEEGRLEYRHLVRNGDGRRPRRQLVTDFSGYNSYRNELHTAPPGENWCGDLHLECEVTLGADASSLALELGKGTDRFVARFETATGACKLLRKTGQATKELASATTAVKAPGDYIFRLANVDRRLLLWVNEDLPFADGAAYDAPPAEGPTEENDLQPAALTLKGSGGVRKLKLWRDTYFTAARHGQASAPDAAGEVDFADPQTWGPLRKLPVRTYPVPEGQYFLLGENSPESGDSRSDGAVPAPLLLGKAFLVYYPFGRAGRLR